MKEVTVQIDPLLADNLKFDEESLALVYDGKAIAGLTTEIKFAKIAISLITANGSYGYEQTVIVYPS